MPRAIAILIDAGQSMDLPILQGQGSGTVLDNAKSIVKEFLNALNSEDFVNIIMFGAKATPLSPSMVTALFFSFFKFRYFTSIVKGCVTERATRFSGSSLLKCEFEAFFNLNFLRGP